MAQQLIDIGGAPNDGDGNPIRDAFAKTNVNFTQLFERYQPPPGNSFGILGDVAGMYAFSANTFYYCYADYTGNTAIWASIPDVGNINQLLNGTSNITIAAADGNIVFWVDGQQTAIFSNTSQSFYVDTSVSGNITASQSVVANVLSAGAGNLQIANNTIYSDADIIIDPFNDGGNSVGNLIIRGNVSVLGNVEFVDVTTSYTSNLLWVAAESANTAALANGAGLAVGPVGNYYGSFTYSSVEDAWRTAQAIIPSANSTSSIGTANIWWANAYVDTIDGNSISLGGTLTAADAAFIGNVTAFDAVFSNNISANSFAANTFIANGLSANNLVLVGDLTSENIIANANVVGDAISGNTANIAGNIDSTGNVNAAGANISGNAVATNFLTAGIISSAGNVTTASNLNAATANLSGSVSALGNVSTAGNVNAAGANISGNAAAANFVTAGIVSATGNVITAGNLTAAGASVTGNAVAANFITAGQVSSTGNVSTAGSVTAAGEVSAQGNITGDVFVGNGAGLTNINAANITGAYSNSNVAANLAAFGNNPISTTGDITAAYFIGNGALLTDINAANITGAYGNGNVAANLAAFGNNSISTTGNITASAFVGNGSLLHTITGGNVVGNVPEATIANTITAPAQPNITSVGILTAVNTSGAVSAAGNITGNVFTGNAAGLTSLVGSNVTGNVPSAIIANTITAPAQPNITSVGTLTAVSVTGNADVGNINTTGNVTAGYFIGNGSQLTGLPASYSNANTAAFLAAFGSNIVSTTGNITATAFAGNGATLATLTGGNVVGNVSGAVVAGTVTTNAQPNITSVGVLSTLSVTGAITAGSANLGVGNANVGNINATGVIAATTFVGNFQGNISGNLTVPGSNTYVLFNDSGNAGASSGFTYDSGNDIVTVANIVDAAFFTGNGSMLSGIIAANITGTVANANYATFAGNVIRANTANTVVDNAQPNITSVGVLTSVNTSGAISATGNITGDVFVGNGAGLTNINSSNIVGAYGNSNVAANLAAFGNNSISTTGNITSGNVSVTGNITAAYFLGNGSALTGLPASYGNANLADIGSNVIVTTGNITGGYFIGNGSTLTGMFGSASLANIGANSISTTGNISASYFLGDGSQLTGIIAGATVGVNETANTAFYPVFANITSGTLLTANVANTKLTFQPDTGLLSANVVNTVSGFYINPNVIAQSYTVPSGYNAGSYGPITLAANVVVTIPAGSAWTIS